MTTNKEELQTQMNRLLAEAKSLEEKIKAIPEVPPTKFGNPFIAVKSLSEDAAVGCLQHEGTYVTAYNGPMGWWESGRITLEQLFVDEATAKRRIEQLELIEKLREEQGNIDFTGAAGDLTLVHYSTFISRWLTCRVRPKDAVYCADYMLFQSAEIAEKVIGKYKDVLYKLHPAYLQQGVNVYA